MTELIITSTKVYAPWLRRQADVSPAIRPIADETVNFALLPLIVFMRALTKMAISALPALIKQALCPERDRQ